MSRAPASIERALQSPYQGYAYAYPHKTAYRPFAQPRALADVWADVPRDETDVYVHIPFCEMRCGFCNLFTAANLGLDVVARYMAAVEREAAAVAPVIGRLPNASLTLGGGTPTYLDAPDLARLLDGLTGRFGIDLSVNASSVETSPATATADRLDVLTERGIGRISIGVQSFIAAETKALGRPQDPAQVMSALERIRARSFATLNIDLMYGSAAQTPVSLRQSIATALTFAPEEFFLYPLYVRPLTGLDGKAATFDEHRLALYRAGRDALQDAGYSQRSMRMFAKSNASKASGSASGEAGDIHRTIVGLGCGARSRTQRLHYSGRYAVGRAAVLAILADYCQQTEAEFDVVRHGIDLTRPEQMRRSILLDVLCARGLDVALFVRRFAHHPFDVLPELAQLHDTALLVERAGHLMLTPSGLERADAIGPLLSSTGMKQRMAEAALA